MYYFTEEKKRRIKWQKRIKHKGQATVFGKANSSFVTSSYTFMKCLTCSAKVSLVGVIVVVSWVSVHLWAVRGRQMRLLRVKVVRGVGLRHQGVTAGTRGLWSKWFLTPNHILFLLLLLESKRKPKTLRIPGAIPKNSIKIITFKHFPRFLTSPSQLPCCLIPS